MGTLWTTSPTTSEYPVQIWKKGVTGCQCLPSMYIIEAYGQCNQYFFVYANTCATPPRIPTVATKPPSKQLLIDGEPRAAPLELPPWAPLLGEPETTVLPDTSRYRRRVKVSTMPITCSKNTNTHTEKMKAASSCSRRMVAFCSRWHPQARSHPWRQTSAEGRTW